MCFETILLDPYIVNGPEIHDLSEKGKLIKTKQGNQNQQISG
jgi:hypothetical protein